jgi:hypothetical protein
MIVEKYKTWINFFTMGVCSWLCYFGFIIIIHYGITFNSVATMSTVFFSSKFYLNSSLIVVTCALIDLTTYAYDTLFSKNLAGSLMILVQQKRAYADRTTLPYIVLQALKKYDIYKIEAPVKEILPMIGPTENSSWVRDFGPISEENKPNILEIHGTIVRSFFDQVNRQDDGILQEIRVNSA